MKDFFTNYGMAFVFLSLGVKYIQSTHTTFFELKSLENFKPHFKRLFSMYLEIQICKVLLTLPGLEFSKTIGNFTTYLGPISF